MSTKNRIRLFANIPLKKGESYICTPPQVHYLQNVMRKNVGDTVFLFDGKNGEFEGVITQISKKSIMIDVQKKVFDFNASPDVWLLFAPLKKENTDIIVQKAVELGVSALFPVKTEYTFISKINIERIQSQVIEAAEQSRRQDLPATHPIADLQNVLLSWDKTRKLIYLDETGAGLTFAAQSQFMDAPVAFLIGPEGGFSKKELEILKNMSYTVGISLGRRILRSETAAIAALSCWQAMRGDWK
ncbi:MAG: 16S rRNA (uracil(1498)-N(3))-methyltransferase [Alphaproteobacteria bacterium]|nr:16S rRNA (uracil(1498)-N(3))-methyltransferase [Alphaproteobacteria bacterium]